MKLKASTLILFVATLLFNCSKSVKYSDTFKKETSGKYSYNANEIIEVSYENNDIFVHWRGGKLKTISLSKNEFYVADMNKKLRFAKHPENKAQYLSVISEDNGKTTYDYRKIPDNYMTPSMQLKAGNYEAALKGFLEIKAQDSLSPFINERDFNRLGYDYIGKGKYKDAIAVFIMNTKLHPTSDNVYDSLAEAYLISGDSLQAYHNYKKALQYDNGNRHAKRFLNVYKPKVEVDSIQNN
ncbi:tetratricopeptide repeat protein [uncultured Winogradskyella sp.]|uniref:tetratricopeptide repeat protein n=1 Tax=uncultured Winogradskyella sp. TaxID=395353 RepID=UPI0026281347|nr:tetratricopeptide repeat protein [uncultured Winogradskyella sp.]